MTPSKTRPSRREVIQAGIAGAVGLLLPGCSGSRENAQRSASGVASTRVLLMGDQGFQDLDQYRVAAAMTEVYRDRGADFVVALGDNIYQFGAQSPDDPQFETAFEIPYAEIDVPFYMVLGNHDNGTTGNHFEIGNHQVAYHYRTDRTSDRWYMPDRHYSVTHGNVELVVVDSNFLPTPEIPTPIIGLPEGYREAQECWVANVLAAPRTAPWRLAASHHPIVTNYGADSGEDLLMFLRPLAAGVDLHLAGHDHTMQWHAADPEIGAAEYLVVGASSFPTFPDHTADIPLSDHPTRFQNGHRLGFAYLEVFPDLMNVTFYGLALTGEPEVLFVESLMRSGAMEPQIKMPCAAS